MRWWVVLLLAACKPPVAGGECDPAVDNFGVVCADGHVLNCVEGLWVDEGPEWSPDDNGGDLAGNVCGCDPELPDQVVCVYASF